MEDPISKFKSWWKHALADSPLSQKSAVCVSTIDECGFPTGRFVDLKSIDEDCFVFCSSFNSAKGKHISVNSKTSMTFWWDHVGYQVRVLGYAAEISEAKAIEYWQSRSRSAQLTTTAFDQSAVLPSESYLRSRLEHVSAKLDTNEIPKPQTWGAYAVKPVSIEFLDFQESRLHKREFYSRVKDTWSMSLLQP